MTEVINDVALGCIFEDTGLKFTKTAWNYEAQPKTSDQIAKLFLKYDFKTRYYDNWNFKNELHLKFDHHIGYDINSVCVPCLKRNHIHIGDLKETDLMSC